MKPSHRILTGLFVFASTILASDSNVVLSAGEPVDADLLFAGGTLHLGDGEPAGGAGGDLPAVLRWAVVRADLGGAGDLGAGDQRSVAAGEEETGDSLARRGIR